VWISVWISVWVSVWISVWISVPVPVAPVALALPIIVTVWRLFGHAAVALFPAPAGLEFRVFLLFLQTAHNLVERCTTKLIRIQGNVFFKVLDA
jgi:hypothetical protein